MKPYESTIDHFRGRKPLINIIMDGFGLGKQDYTNAIYLARTPFIDELLAHYPNTTLLTHGQQVGLPGEKDLGGSEVGHLTIGAGKLISQGPTRITNAIMDGSFFKRENLLNALKQAKNSSLHLIGLLSDGNVHSHISHFEAVIDEAARQGITRCFVHALLDGRDVGIQTADQYVSQIEAKFQDILTSHPDWEYTFVSGGGREVITMDRDQNWDKVEKGWKTHVMGKSGNLFSSALEAIQYFRDQTPDLVDQDCPPFNIQNKNGEVPTIDDGDAVIFMNFRADRAIELTRAFVDTDFDGFKIEHKPDVFFAGMMVYDEDNNIPENRIMGSASVSNPFGKRILDLGLYQFRLAETQKYAHVTFFFNGGYRNPLDPDKEIYHLIASDKINSFATAPQMKAIEIANKAVELIHSGKFDFGLINLANTDMVGHTGNMEAAIIAAETVDKAVKIICQAIADVGGVALITADHGNADEMIIMNKKTGKEEICTKHSINPVPVIIFDPLYKNNYTLKERTDVNPLNLSMIAATNFILMGRPVPDDLNDPLIQD